MYIHHMKRISVFLSETQIKKVKAQAKVKGIKFAELLRRYIDKGIDDDTQNKARGN